MGFDYNLAILANDFDKDDVNGAIRKGRVDEEGLTLKELELEIVDVFEKLEGSLGLSQSKRD